MQLFWQFVVSAPRYFSIKPACGDPNRKGTAGYAMRPKDALCGSLL
jgi:hypothetical protein